MPRSTARPTIDRPKSGAKISGKSVITSIVNIAAMFRLLRGFAFRQERSPREAALAGLRRRDYMRAETGLSALRESAAPPAERAFLFNKRGVARIGFGDRVAA